MPIGSPMGAFGPGGPGGFAGRPMGWGNWAQGPGQVPGQMGGGMMQPGGGGMREQGTPLNGPAPLGPGSLPTPQPFGIAPAGPGMGLAQPMQAPTGGLQPPMGGLGGGGGAGGAGGFGQGFGQGQGGMDGFMNLLMQHPAIQNLMQGFQGSQMQTANPGSGYGIAQHPLSMGPNQGLPTPFSPAWQQRMQQGPGSLGQAAQPLPAPFSPAWQQRMQGPQDNPGMAPRLGLPSQIPSMNQNQPPAPFSPGWAQWMQNQNQQSSWPQATQMTPQQLATFQAKYPNGIAI